MLQIQKKPHHEGALAKELHCIVHESDEAFLHPKLGEEKDAVEYISWVPHALAIKATECAMEVIHKEYGHDASVRELNK